MKFIVTLCIIMVMLQASIFTRDEMKQRIADAFAEEKAQQKALEEAVHQNLTIRLNDFCANLENKVNATIISLQTSMMERKGVQCTEYETSFCQNHVGLAVGFCTMWRLDALSFFTSYDPEKEIVCIISVNEDFTKGYHFWDNTMQDDTIRMFFEKVEKQKEARKWLFWD